MIFQLYGTMVPHLESSSISSENWSYHIYDYINGVMYDVYYNRIEKDTFDVSDRAN